MSFHSLKDLIPKTAGKYQLQGEMRAALVINRASALLKEILPEEVNCHVRVKRFQKGILWVGVSNAAVAQELLLKSYQLKQKINQQLDEDLIQQIRSFQESIEPEEFHQ